MDMKSQTEQIRRHLERGHWVTSIVALNKWGCLRLAARIKNLRDEGMAIVTEYVHRNGKHFAKYHL